MLSGYDDRYPEHYYGLCPDLSYTGSTQGWITLQFLVYKNGNIRSCIKWTYTHICNYLFNQLSRCFILLIFYIMLIYHNFKSKWSQTGQRRLEVWTIPYSLEVYSNNPLECCYRWESSICWCYSVKTWWCPWRSAWAAPRTALVPCPLLHTLCWHSHHLHSTTRN